MVEYVQRSSQCSCRCVVMYVYATLYKRATFPPGICHLQQVSVTMSSRTFTTLVRDKAYINGAWVNGAEGKTFEVKNPANGKVIANVANLGDDETQQAIDAAHEVVTIVEVLHFEL